MVLSETRGAMYSGQDKTRPGHPPILGWAMTGTSMGPVRSLPGFRKGVHHVPDRTSPAVDAFVARVAEEQINGLAEDLYQRARVDCGYRRKDLVLTWESPVARLEAPGFTIEIDVGSDPENPSCYRQTLRLCRIDPERLHDPATARLFPTAFDTLEIVLRRTLRVEDLIDAVEDASSPEWSIHYPSSCEWCELGNTGLSQRLIVEGNGVSLTTPHPGPPSRLVEAYHAFGQVLTSANGETLLPGLPFLHHAP